MFRLTRAFVALSIVSTALLLSPRAARADVPDAVWEALRERAVVVDRSDGTKVTGKLAGVRPDVVVVLTDAGEPLMIERAKVAGVRAAAAPPAPSWDALVGAQVRVETTDHKKILGKLVSFDEREVVVELGDERKLKLARGSVLAVGPAPTPEVAREEPWVGRQVVVETTARTTIEGRLEESTNGSVLIATARGQSLRIARGDIASIHPKDGAPGPDEASADKGPAHPFDLRGYVGALLRPMVCAAGCSGTRMSFGVEVGYWFAGAAVRVAPGDKGVSIAADLRLFYDFRPLPPLSITPLVELSPNFYLSGGDLAALELVVHPGVRVGYQPIPRLGLFVEPIGFEISAYTNNNSGGVLDDKTHVRWAPSAGAQLRF